MSDGAQATCYPFTRLRVTGDLMQIPHTSGFQKNVMEIEVIFSVIRSVSTLCNDLAPSILVALGLLHHLDDDEGRNLRLAAALRPRRRLLTNDGCYLERQSAVKRYPLSRGRGLFVRTAHEYEMLSSLANFSRSHEISGKIA